MRRGLLLMLLGAAGLTSSAGLIWPHHARAAQGPCIGDITGPCVCGPVDPPHNYGFCTGFRYQQFLCMGTMGSCEPHSRQCYGDTSTTWTYCSTDSTCSTGCEASGDGNCMRGDSNCCVDSLGNYDKECGKFPG